MKKGFTLIELLAVILILGIIALIAIPTVNNILKEARRGAFSSTLTNIEKAIENECTLSQIKNKDINYTYTITDGIISPSVEIKGDLPDGTIYVDGECKVNYTLYNNNFSAVKENDETKIEDKKIYTEDILNKAVPVLSNNLIPVTIYNDGTVKKADIYSKWYSYEEKLWANAVILFGEDNYNSGDVINEDDIKQYYVWIPRYKYKLWNVISEKLYPNGSSESPIEIVFENKNTNVSNGDENGEWLTHPAFTSFNTNGIWVGKFETSYNEETFTDNSLFLTSNPNTSVATSGANIVIKPNVRSLTNKNVSTFYTLSREVNNALNSHMMKNTEWGATAYLTYSIYGKCTGNTCEEVYLNNVNTGYLNETTSFSGQWGYSSTVTGCSASSVSADVNSNNNTCESGYAWNESSNNASTTGNITGIYDMSGGNWEYMMAVVSDKDGNLVSGRNSTDNSGFNSIFGCPTCDSNTSGLTELTTGISFPDQKYYDLYKYNYEIGTDIWFNYLAGKLGDATKEIAKTKENSSSGDRGLWYSDYALSPSLAYPWFTRGGNFGDGAGAGILNFRRKSGYAYSYNSFRLVLAY